MPDQAGTDAPGRDLPVPGSTNVVKNPQQTDRPLFIFSTPKINLSMALHRRANRWYIVWGRAYGMAVTRWVSSLNSPRPTDPPTTAPPKGLEHLNHRFWFNPSCEENAEEFLQDLLSATKPFIKVTGNSRREKAGRDPKNEVEIDARQVEILVSDEELSRKCSYCGTWESDGDERRWYKVEDGVDPVYWCGYCSKFERRGLWSILTDIPRNPDSKPDYF
ncbi:hypothetical protein NEOLEDRAFT_1176477 [Neolentinus lepideus HHB14362 ss-1]|uniref:Uncharacterized protein n=1 Tax=Neolentinus lepideus HHB14362 ss-1 TaxID=1314782 RepID=A0A165UB40_9AGAM|nr:hypothetical protein NEOLEDRAFT_1176477 [Neolentinus lepideus HHB14362 ss-1]